MLKKTIMISLVYTFFSAFGYFEAEPTIPFGLRKGSESYSFVNRVFRLGKKIYSVPNKTISTEYSGSIYLIVDLSGSSPSAVIETEYDSTSKKSVYKLFDMVGGMIIRDYRTCPQFIAYNSYSGYASSAYWSELRNPICSILFFSTPYKTGIPMFTRKTSSDQSYYSAYGTFGRCSPWYYNQEWQCAYVDNATHDKTKEYFDDIRAAMVKQSNVTLALFNYAISKADYLRMIAVSKSLFSHVNLYFGCESGYALLNDRGEISSYLGRVGYIPSASKSEVYIAPFLSRSNSSSGMSSSFTLTPDEISECYSGNSCSLAFFLDSAVSGGFCSNLYERCKENGTRGIAFASCSRDEYQPEILLREYDIHHSVGSESRYTSFREAANGFDALKYSELIGDKLSSYGTKIPITYSLFQREIGTPYKENNYIRIQEDYVLYPWNTYLQFHPLMFDFTEAFSLNQVFKGYD